MTATDWGVLLAAITLVVTIPTLLLMLVQEFRARERADVEWEVERVRQGVFTITNAGSDSAQHVRVEMWSRTEIQTAQGRRIGPTEQLELTLPDRSARGPEPVEGLPEPVPRPHGIAIPQATLENLVRLRREAEQQQVTVKIVWRTRWGSWKSYRTHTG